MGAGWGGSGGTDREAEVREQSTETGNKWIINAWRAQAAHEQETDGQTRTTRGTTGRTQGRIVLEHPAFSDACAMLLSAGEVNGLAAAAAAAAVDHRSTRVRQTDRLVEGRHIQLYNSASLSLSFGFECLSRKLFGHRRRKETKMRNVFQQRFFGETNHGIYISVQRQLFWHYRLS